MSTSASIAAKIAGITMSQKPKFNHKADLLQSFMHRFFYNQPEHYEQMLYFLGQHPSQIEALERGEKVLLGQDGEKKISLRVVDWFVTNFARKFSTSYMIGDRNFIVHQDYKSQLDAFQKKQFDPFCRGGSFDFEYSPGKTIKTNLGQLNFFRWATENRVLNYIRTNHSEIEADMEAANRAAAAEAAASALASAAAASAIAPGSPIVLLATKSKTAPAAASGAGGIAIKTRKKRVTHANSQGKSFKRHNQETTIFFD